MEMEIKHYLHFYIGCEIIYCDKPLKIYTLTISELNTASYTWNVKPILRPLSDMTHDEIIWMFVLRATANGETVDKKCRRTSLEKTFMQIEFKDLSSFYQDIKTLYPNQFNFLISKGFDLFGLIESGLAIDKTTLKNNQ